MNIDEKLKNMRPKDTPLLVLGYMLLGMILLLAPAKANAEDGHNHVHIDQEGDNLVMDILPVSYTHLTLPPRDLV